MNPERLPSGDAGLDAVTGGGLPRGSLIVIAGAPGTGKTILAQQLAFLDASPEHKAVYYTTWSEPHDKLVKHLGGFAFFDQAKLEECVEFVNVSDLAVGDDGLDAVAQEIVRKCFREQPSVVVLDSSKALQDVAGGAGFRKAIYDLASRVSHTGTLLLFVGEYTPAQIEEAAEFAVADGIVQVLNEQHGPVARRSLRVLKMRGAAPLPGRHSVEISAAGFRVFPRLETTLQPKEPVTAGRAGFGIEQLDARFGGGLPCGDATLLLGPSGVGKTVLALRYLATGLEAGEGCLYVSFQETAGQLAAKARSLGWSIDDALASGALAVLHIPPVEIDLDAVGFAIRAALAEREVSRIVVDSLAELTFAARETERLPAYLWALGGHIRGSGASVVFTNEIATLGPVTDAAGGLSLLFNNVVLLRYLELDAGIGRALAVLKMRNSDHAKSLIRFEIGESGLVLLGEVADATGVLGWSALRSGG